MQCSSMAVAVNVLVIIIEKLCAHNATRVAVYFSKWVKEHQRYPRKAKKAGIQGRVVVGFTIDEKGRMTDVKVVRGVHPLLDKEALRVIKSAPKKWTAGTRNGKSFAFKYTIAVSFGTTGI